MPDDQTQSTDTPSPEESAGDLRRREALRKIAVFGAYTAPAMLAVLTAKKAMAASSGGGCCWVDARLASGQRVGDAQVGDPLLQMRPDGSAVFEGAVTATRPSLEPCILFETDSGIRLTCSYSTPIPVMRDGAVDYVDARDCLISDMLPVQDDGGFRWERLAKLNEMGDLPVALLSCADGVYAAGDHPNRLIYTHNIKKI